MAPAVFRDRLLLREASPAQIRVPQTLATGDLMVVCADCDAAGGYCELHTTLDEALWAYMRRLEEIFKTLSDDQLLRFVAAPLEEGDNDDWRFTAFQKSRAHMEYSFRELFRHAKPVLESEGFSGAYCVFHGCDMKDCASEHVDD